MTRSGVERRPGGHDLLLAALSSVALVVLVIGVPVVLYAIGSWPLSHLAFGHLVHPNAAPRSDTSQAEHWLVGSSLALIWITWAWMTVCVVLEWRSWATGRSSARLPASRTMQSVAACLVGTVLTVSALGKVGATTSAPAGSRASGSHLFLGDLRIIDDLDSGFGLQTAGGRLSAERDRAEPRVHVRDGASNASQEGGRGLEVPSEGDDAAPSQSVRSTEGSVAIRVDRPTASPVEPSSGEVTTTTRSVSKVDGESLTRDWATSPGQTRPVRTSPVTHLVLPRETLWSIATDCLGSSRRWRELANLNYGVRQSDGAALTADHWIRPGWTLQLPSTGVPSPIQPVVHRESAREVSEPIPEKSIASPSASSSSASSASSASRFETSAIRPDTAASPPDLDRSPLQRHPVPLTPIGGGIVGAGVVSILDRMRRAQQRHREGGTYIRLPNADDRTFERRLRLGSGQDLVEQIDWVVKQLAGTALSGSASAPIVEGIRVHPDVIELAVDSLDPRVALPSGFESLGDQRTIMVDRVMFEFTPTEDPFGVTSRSPAPLLVTAGNGPDGLVMVNLESIGCLFIEGGRSDGESVLRALALELATSRWAGQFDLWIVGFGEELERFDRVTSVTRLSDLIHQLSLRHVEAQETLRRFGHRSYAEARATDRSGRWDPVVVLCGPTMDEGDISDLHALAADSALGMAMVAVGRNSGDPHALRLVSEDLSGSLELLGSVVFPQQVDAEEYSGVNALLETASNRTPVLASEEPYVAILAPLPTLAVGPVPGLVDPSLADTSGRVPGTVPAAPVGSPTTVPPAEIPDPDDRRHPAPHQTDGQTIFEVEVMVLGPVEIRGAARGFTRAWAEELVIYLALHPNGAANEVWATALWPDRLMAPSSLHSTASVARRSLGIAEDGSDHLPRSHGRLALGPSVGTDWSRFVALSEAGDLRSWRKALELVRGRPFDGLRSSDWPILEGIGPAIEAAVVDLSGRLAGAELAAGNPRGAEWAARRGLLASPYDERLYRMLMRAADAGGNPSGVETAMRDLIKLVADGVEPFDSVHPATTELYRSLTRRRRLGTAVAQHGSKGDHLNDAKNRSCEDRPLGAGRKDG